MRYALLKLKGISNTETSRCIALDENTFYYLTNEGKVNSIY